MVEKIFDLIKDNLKNPKLYISLLVVLLVTLVLLPYIDANFFYYDRVDNRIDILSKVVDIDVEKIKDNEILHKEYTSILSEIEKQSSGSVGSIIVKESNKTVNTIKFITGGVILWLIAIMCIFIKNFGSLGARVLGFVVFVVLGCLLGFAAKAIPTILNPWVNYIGVPLLITIVVALLCTGGKKNKNRG